MAYGDKFKLDFSDDHGNPRQILIQKKDYTGDVKTLVGTANPVVIKWDSDDDIYDPIRGSTCELNLFVTDDTDYDNWYEADEREYKVVIGVGTSLGAIIWDLISDDFDTSDLGWDDTGNTALSTFWEGFLVVDRYAEAFSHKPFPIKLIASDGLGTLDGFDAPESTILVDSNGNPNPSANQSNFDTLWHYVVEILKLTGLDFNIIVAHMIRKTTQSDGTSATNEDDQLTIFHDISIKEWAFLGKNFKTLSAKKLLFKILRAVNARIFQSDGRWYITSNSNLLDARIYAAVPEANPIDPNDTNNALDEERPNTVVSTPSCELLDFEMLTNQSFILIELSGFDVDTAESNLNYVINVTPFDGTLSDGNNVINTTPHTLSSNTVKYTPTSGFVGSDLFRYSVSNGTNSSSACAVTIQRKELVVPPVDNMTPVAENQLAFHVRADSVHNLFYGETLDEAISRARSFTNSLMFTHFDHFFTEFGYNTTTSGGQTVDKFDFMTKAQFNYSYGLQKYDNADTNLGDHSFEVLQRGGIPSVWAEFEGTVINPNITVPSNYTRYNPDNNTVDESWQFGTGTIVYPRLEQPSNGVVNLPDGYYAFRGRPPYSTASFTIFGRRELEARGFRIPQYSSFDVRSSSDPLLQLRNLTTTSGAIYPEELKELQVQSQGNFAFANNTPTNQSIIYAKLIKDKKIVTRWEISMRE